MSDFEHAFAVVVTAEGGYVNDLDDPGGETKFGISKSSYPEIDIKNLTVAQAKEIYRRDYWDACKCDLLPKPMNLLVFDAAVNQGVDAAIKLLQKALGIAQDGRLGQATLAAASNRRAELPALYLAERSMRYMGTRHFDKYGRGWLKRLFVLAGETAA